MIRLQFISFIGIVLQFGVSFAQQPQKLINSVGMEFVLIPKGSFIRGSPPNELKRHSNENMHHVTLTEDYYLGVYEVTQGQFEQIMGRNPSRFQGDVLRSELKMKSLNIADFPSEKLPVESVSWIEAVEFCRALSNLAEEARAGREYRLPTEAEWEYACRAESHTAYFFGDDPKQLGDYAWYEENSHELPHPVGLKKPNRWGLYDIQGNVTEWCSDGFDDFYPKLAVKDPIGVSGLSLGIGRGGCFRDTYFSCRSAKRWAFSQEDDGHRDLGFRVAMTITK